MPIYLCCASIFSSEFYADKSIIAPSFDRFADQHFIMTGTIKIAGVQKVDAVVQCLPDRCDTFFLVGS